MMARQGVVKWYCETWQQWFWLLESCPRKTAHKYLVGKKLPEDQLNFSHSGKTIWHRGGVGPIIVWTSPQKSLAARCAILAHECVHAAHICLDRAGVRPDFENDEAVTYLVTVLVRRALGDFS